jgi:hypothetical protein
MVFSNKGNPIKAGDRVNVMIGSFHFDGAAGRMIACERSVMDELR